MPTQTHTHDDHDKLRPLAPSAKYIFLTLETAGPLTFDELHHETTLPKSTLSNGLDALEAAGLVTIHNRAAPQSQWEYQLV